MFIQPFKAQAGMLDGPKGLSEFNSFNAFYTKKGLWVKSWIISMQEKSLEYVVPFLSLQKSSPIWKMVI